MKKFLKTIFISFFIIIGFLMLNVIINPNRWSENMIKRFLLIKTPIGIHVEKTKEYIKSRNWKILNIDEENGIIGSKKNCDYKSIGKLSNEMHRYECDSKFDYKFACEANGGKLCNGCFPDACLINKKPIFVDRKIACSRVGGRLIRKTIKVNEYCELGKKYIRSEIGNYMTLFPLPLPVKTYVYVEWIFNNGGSLVDIRVKKEIDAP